VQHESAGLSPIPIHYPERFLAEYAGSVQSMTTQFTPSAH